MIFLEKEVNQQPGHQDKVQNPRRILLNPGELVSLPLAYHHKEGLIEEMQLVLYQLLPVHIYGYQTDNMNYLDITHTHVPLPWSLPASKIHT